MKIGWDAASSQAAAKPVSLRCIRELPIEWVAFGIRRSAWHFCDQSPRFEPLGCIPSISCSFFSPVSKRDAFALCHDSSSTRYQCPKHHIIRHAVVKNRRPAICHFRLFVFSNIGPLSSQANVGSKTLCQRGPGNIKRPTYTTRCSRAIPHQSGWITGCMQLQYSCC
ncbi:hypothetical protein V8C44DRAFT_76467 [Trichoderma aethiopicum]